MATSSKHMGMLWHQYLLKRVMGSYWLKVPNIIYPHSPGGLQRNSDLSMHYFWPALPGGHSENVTPARTVLGNPYPYWHKIGKTLENPTLCGTENSQKGTLPVLAYGYWRQWEWPPPPGQHCIFDLGIVVMLLYWDIISSWIWHCIWHCIHLLMLFIF